MLKWLKPVFEKLFLLSTYVVENLAGLVVFKFCKNKGNQFHFLLTSFFFFV